MANIFARFWNFSTGWLHSSQSRLEATRPDIVYDQALKAEGAKYKSMEDAVAGLVYNRNKLETDIEDTRSKLEEVQSMQPGGLRNTKASSASSRRSWGGSRTRRTRSSLRRRWIARPSN